MCNQCDFATSLAGNLRTHLKTHSGEKSNKCNQCEFVSLQASDLKRHLKTHNQDKTKRCKQFNIASSQSSNLRTHTKAHLKTQVVETPNKSSHFDYSFSQEGNLRRHLKMLIRRKVKELKPVWLLCFCQVQKRKDKFSKTTTKVNWENNKDIGLICLKLSIMSTDHQNFIWSQRCLID